MLQHVVNEFLVEFGTEGTSAQRLCLTTSEDSTSVRHGQRRNLAPDGADVSGLTTIETDTLVEDATAHGVALHVVEL